MGACDDVEYVAEDEEIFEGTAEGDEDDEGGDQEDDEQQ